MQYKIKVGINEDGTPKMKSFRALLLTRCQEEFEKGMSVNEELDKLKQAMEDALTVRRGLVYERREWGELKESIREAHAWVLQGLYKERRLFRLYHHGGVCM